MIYIRHLHMKHRRHTLIGEVVVRGAHQALDVEVAVARQMRAHLR